MPPEEVTQAEIDRFIECDLYFAEHERIERVPYITEGLGE